MDVISVILYNIKNIIYLINIKKNQNKYFVITTLKIFIIFVIHNE